jgi:hypothetical protein
MGDSIHLKYGNIEIRTKDITNKLFYKTLNTKVVHKLFMAPFKLRFNDVFGIMEYEEQNESLNCQLIGGENDGQSF